METVLRPLLKGFSESGFFGELFSFRFVLWQMIVQHITVRYKRTSLGFVWTLINPLLNMSVTATVFSMIMKIPVKDYAVFLFAGMIPWICFNSCITQAGMSIIYNEGLIKKIYLPRHIFPTAVVTALLIETLLSTMALFIIALTIGAKLTIALIFLPVSFILLYAFCLGATLIFSILFVYFRDMQQIATVTLQAIYYLTPIIYPTSMVPARFHHLLQLNPFTYIIAVFRAPLYDGKIPDITTIAFASAVAFGTFLIGWSVFRSRAQDLVFRL